MNEPAATPPEKPSHPSTPRVQLVIRVNQAGQIEVSGPIHDKMTCYALLENARDVIKDHVDKMQRSQIVPVGAVDPFLMSRRPNGNR